MQPRALVVGHWTAQIWTLQLMSLHEGRLDLGTAANNDNRSSNNDGNNKLNKPMTIFSKKKVLREDDDPSLHAISVL